MRTNWDVRKAMAALDIEAVPFDDKFAEMARGYSFKRTLAIRPGERYQVFIALHEMAHVVLGHIHYLETFFENAPHMTADSVMAKVATAAPTILRAGL